MLNAKYNLHLAFVVALAATLGSLYLSEVRHLGPCVLCWYQRMFMYPLVFLTGLALWRSDKNVWPYVLALSIPGAAIAVYHYVLQMGIIPDWLAPCSLGVSCTTIYVEYFGFVTIPFMSFTTFFVIIILAARALTESTK